MLALAPVQGDGHRVWYKCGRPSIGRFGGNSGSPETERHQVRGDHAGAGDMRSM